MPALPDVPSVVRFGPYEADLRSGELRKNRTTVRLQQRPFQLLAVLLENPGSLVTREELRHRLWAADTFVDFDNSLNTAITKLREALGDTADEHRYIETLARRGYRFVATVSEEIATDPAGRMVELPLVVPPRSQEVPAVPTASESKGRSTVARWLFLTAVAVVGGLLFWGTRRLNRSVAAPPNRVMLAVLPFDNLSPDVGQDYFSDGLTEEIITDLGRFNPARLGVIARNSIMLYKGKAVPVGKVGQDLGVQYVVEGSVRRYGGRARVSAQLIRVSDQTHLWAQNYEYELGDILKLQAEVSSAIAREVRVELVPVRQARLGSSYTVNSDAYDAYVRGRYYWNQRTQESLAKSLEYFERAAALDPNYAPAYAGIADSYGVLAGMEFERPETAFPKAKAAALKALELDESLAEAHVSLASVFAYYWDWAAAEREFRRALELNPNYATAHQWYSEYLSNVGRLQEAVGEMSRARELDPLSPNIAASLALAYSLAGDPRQGLAAARKAVEQYPDNHFAHWNVGFAYLHSGEYEQAILALNRALSLSYRAPYVLGLLGYTYAGAGRRKEALHLANELEQLATKGESVAFYRAMIYTALGDKEKAFRFLDVAIREHKHPIPVGLHDRMMFNSLRSDPRWAELVGKVFPHSRDIAKLLSVEQPVIHLCNLRPPYACTS
jgi:TolB-like protein/DNA-binding winged helix-turn-helix (wHTH) protein/Flp pilus assembly protein TadD